MIKGIHKPRILIIDDSKTIREILRGILEEAGFEVLMAQSGEEGLITTFNELPDLVMVDLLMPKMDGFEVVKRIREELSSSNIPIIMVTSMNDDYSEVKGLTLGINDYITKPFNKTVVVARITALLERSSYSTSLNPLTLLPGNILLTKEIKGRIISNKKFAVLYLDLNHFKAFNDYYGFKRGDDVILRTSNVLLKAVKENKSKDDFVGHVGGDDFIVITSPGRAEEIALNIISEFDKTAPFLYDKKDREKGFIDVKDRAGNLEKFGFISIAIAIVTNLKRHITHTAEISQIAAQLKAYAKTFGKSTYVIDRRSKKEDKKVAP